MTAKLFLFTLFIAKNYCNEYSTNGTTWIKIKCSNLESFQNLLQSCIECWDAEYTVRFHDEEGYISIDVTELVNDDLEITRDDIITINKSISYE